MQTSDNQDPTIEQLMDSDPRVQRLKSMSAAALWSEIAKPTFDEEPQDPQEGSDYWVCVVAATYSHELASYYDRPVVKLRRSEVLAWATRVGLVPAPGLDPKSPA